jgi:FtsH-binding integral membrane protein
MKRLMALVLIGISLAVFSVLKQPALAFDINMPTTTTNGICSSGSSAAYCSETAGQGQDKITGSTGLLVTVVDIISIVAGITAVIVILVGAIKYMTSAGEPNELSSAKNMIMFALIGLAILALAEVIVQFVISKAP